MKIQILGTAAYERVPSMFCECPICQYAREHGGKEIRTQAQVLINDDLLVDFGHDNYSHFLQNGIDFRKIESLLITHAHSDHYMVKDLVMARAPYSHSQMHMQLYGGPESYGMFRDLLHDLDPNRLGFTPVEAYETFRVGKYTVTAMPARHGTETPYTYVITDGEKTVLYGNDSGIEFDEVYDFMEKQGYRFDLVISDCTNAQLHFDYVHSHKSFLDNKEHKARLTKAGNVTDKTKWVITHFSHNGLNTADKKPITHEDLCKIAEDMGMIAAYDGMVIEI